MVIFYKNGDRICVYDPNTDCMNCTTIIKYYKHYIVRGFKKNTKMMMTYVTVSLTKYCIS